jgi:predicted MPP superfamily phosphohydrolase
MKTPGFKMSRRRFLGGVSVAAAGTFVYAHFFEAERLQKSFLTVPLSNGAAKSPLKLLHVSDLHASPVVSLRYIRRALEIGLAWQPDLICVTGDFITQKFRDMPSYVEVLRLLSRTAPTFASFGNHDGGRWAAEEGGYPDQTWVRTLLAQSEIQLLHNNSNTIHVQDRTLNVVGCGDLWAADFDAQRAFAKRTKGETILLSHNPDTKDHLNVFDWNLMLSGHTHGGQLRVPWIGATPFAPVQDKRFVSGLHRWNERWIHVTKGIGSIYGARINCPPEVSFLTLT